MNNACSIKLFFLLILLSKVGFTQIKDAEFWYKFSPEFTLVKHKFELKIRPGDITDIPAKTLIRLDFALGYSIKNLKIYEYSKIDNHQGAWTGLKIDYNLFLLDKRLLIHLQERYFWGLNSNSPPHYYLVDMLVWKFNDNLSAGYLAYGKWKIEQAFCDGLWFHGPIIIYKLPLDFELQLAITRDIFHNYYMPLSKLSYKLKI